MLNHAAGNRQIALGKVFLDARKMSRKWAYVNANTALFELPVLLLSRRAHSLLESTESALEMILEKEKRRKRTTTNRDLRRDNAHVASPATRLYLLSQFADPWLRRVAGFPKTKAISYSTRVLKYFLTRKGLSNTGSDHIHHRNVVNAFDSPIAFSLSAWAGSVYKLNYTSTLRWLFRSPLRFVVAAYFEAFPCCFDLFPVVSSNPFWRSVVFCPYRTSAFFGFVSLHSRLHPIFQYSISAFAVERVW